MSKLNFRPFTAADISGLMALQLRYAAAYPGALIVPGEAYLGPGFQGGANVLCCTSDQGQLLGYAVVFAYLAQGADSEPHTVWAEVRADPSLADPYAVKSLLFDHALARARVLTQDTPGHPVDLAFQYFTSETPSIDFVIGKGCVHTENVYQMARDLAQPLTPCAPPAGITLQAWRMESEAEQQHYLQARNAAFPAAPKSLGDWQYFTHSPLWAVGTTLAAFVEDYAGESRAARELVGSVLVYWDEAEHRHAPRKMAYTETIFVLPPWRGRGIARALVTTALAYLQVQGMAEARLEVRAQNEDALRLYRGLGYTIVNESGLYIRKIAR